MESVPNQNIEEIINYLKEKSVYFNNLSSDEDFLYSEINKLTQERINKIIKQYGEEESDEARAVNYLRLVIAKELQKGKINKELIPIIKDKFITKQLEYFEPYLSVDQINNIKKYASKKDPFSNWKSPFNCLYTFIYDIGEQKKIIDNLNEVASLVRSQLKLENYDIYYKGFEGENKYGTDELNIRIYPNNLRDFKASVFYFIAIKEGEFFAGIDKGGGISKYMDIPEGLKGKEYHDINATINFFKENNMFVKDQNEKIYDAIKPRNYWAAGIKWNEENKLEGFNKNKCWEIGHDKDPKNKGSKQAWENIGKVKIGDYIAFKSYGGKSTLTIHQISQVTGIDEKKGKIYFRKLEDENLFKGQAPSNKPNGWFGTLCQITNPQAIETIFGDLIFMEKENTNLLVTQYKELLENTHNIILHGAPGTGKTHLAKDIAKAMGAEIEFVQFHPSYDYTDFVEGLRPFPLKKVRIISK